VAEVVGAGGHPGVGKIHVDHRKSLQGADDHYFIVGEDCDLNYVNSMSYILY
jgi:hypothetical protein